MNKFLSKALLASCFFFTAMQANAGLVTANTTINLNTAITGSSWTGVGHALDSTVRVQSGDTVTINIDFLGNQLLNWDSNGYFNPWLMLGSFPGGYENWQSGQFYLSDLTVSLLNLTAGSQFAANQLNAHSSGNIHLGPTLTLGSDNIARTFSGVSLSFKATWSDGDAYRDFGTIGYYTPMFGGTVSVSQAAAVPEPASLALFGLALLGIAFARKKKTA